MHGRPPHCLGFVVMRLNNSSFIASVVLFNSAFKRKLRRLTYFFSGKVAVSVSVSLPRLTTTAITSPGFKFLIASV